MTEAPSGRLGASAIAGGRRTAAGGASGTDGKTHLPPAPPIDWTGNRQRRLERATLALGRLDAVSTLLPDTRLFLYSYVRREAVLSSEIDPAV